MAKVVKFDDAQKSYTEVDATLEAIDDVTFHEFDSVGEPLHNGPLVALDNAGTIVLKGT